VVLQKSFCDRKKIKPGTTLRVTEVGEGLYITPIAEPTEQELKEVIASAGSLTRRQTADEAQLVRKAIADYRSERRSRRR